MTERPDPVQFATKTVTAGVNLAGSAPPGTIAGLAWALAEHARACRLVVVRLVCSRISNSATKHLELRDAQGHVWLIRVSDHPTPSSTGYDKPHFDLVSRDGQSGVEVAIGFLNRVARGDEPWAPTERDRKGQHRRHSGQRFRRRSGSGWGRRPLEEYDDD